MVSSDFINLIKILTKICNKMIVMYSFKLSKLFYCCLEIIISVAGKKFMIPLLHGIKNGVFIPK